MTDHCDRCDKCGAELAGEYDPSLRDRVDGFICWECFMPKPRQGLDGWEWSLRAEWRYTGEVAVDTSMMWLQEDGSCKFAEAPELACNFCGFTSHTPREHICKGPMGSMQRLRFE